VTRAELRAGVGRLGLVVSALVATAIVLGLGSWLGFGGSLRARIGAGFAFVAAALLLGGIVAYLAAAPLVREGSWAGGTMRIADRDERRQKELLAAGLLVLGIGMFAVALGIAA
jgi:hypothetical protein